MSTSIFNRRKDLFYLVFFCIHLVVMFNVDLVLLYPEWMKQRYMLDLRDWQIATFKDNFFSSPPAWFKLYIYLELLYHVPFCLWAIPALRANDPRVPVQLLIYALETGITTITCIADYLSWTTVTAEEKWRLSAIYVPYLAISVFMGVDMVARLNTVVMRNGPAVVVEGKKGR